MTTAEIKHIVDEERVEQLTLQLCRHWEVATERLEALVQDMEAGIDTCVEAEIYAALMRMQSSVMTLMELNKMPSAFLFSEYLDRISQIVSNTAIRQSVMTLAQRLFGEKTEQQRSSFFELILQSIAQHDALSPEQQEAVLQQASPLEHIFSVCAQYLTPSDLMMAASLFQNLNTDGGNSQEVTDQLTNMRQTMDNLSAKMGESLQQLLIWLVMLMLLPGLMVGMMQQSRTDSKAMAKLFNKVLERVRKSNEWWEYWKERRETLRVVSDDLSWKQIMKAEQSKEREALGKVPGALFAKWTTDRKAFEEDFLDARLADDDLRYFIFHLAALYEINREQNPTTKFGEEQLVRNETQQVGDAVLEAAMKLQDLTTKAWFPHYESMWQELIQNENVFANLKVTRRSPHNHLFTARFFCHLVGEMKKSAVFGTHSDHNLAEKLVDKSSVDTFRKNIQEGMGTEKAKVKISFSTIFQKYKQLANQNSSCTL